MKFKTQFKKEKPWILKTLLNFNKYLFVNFQKNRCIIFIRIDKKRQTKKKKKRKKKKKKKEEKKKKRNESRT